MEVVNGKVLITSDWHFGIRNNASSRLGVCVNMMKEHIQAVKTRGVSAVIMGGDVFHERASVNVNTLNVAIKCVEALAKLCRVYLVCGNHDCFMKNATDINSLNMFRNIGNVKVVARHEELLVNGRRCLLAPWLTDMTVFEPESFDMVVGHFEISSKYLIQSYIEDQAAKKTTSSATGSKLDSDDILAGGERKSASLVGNFVDVVKRGGIVWAGHIHKRKEFSAKGRKFIFIGSPTQQTMADVGDERGFYILDENCGYEFIGVVNAPVHVKIKMSDAVAGKFDFKNVTGNIVQKIYDVNVGQADDAVIAQKITDFKPFEELLSEYEVEIENTAGSGGGSELDMIRKSKLEYMRKYVDNIEQDALSEQGVDRDALYETLESYYGKVTGQAG